MDRIVHVAWAVRRMTYSLSELLNQPECPRSADTDSATHGVNNSGTVAAAGEHNENAETRTFRASRY